MITGGTNNKFVVETGDKLKTPDTGDYDTATHVFLGWTPDTTGSSEPLEYVDGLLGDVKLYAVWGVPNNTATPIVNASTLLTGNDLVNTQGTVATSGSATMTYSSSSNGKITLTANLQVNTSIMKDAVGEYQWFKGDPTNEDNKISGATSSTYDEIKTVDDNATYSYKYSFHSQSEPFWIVGGTGKGVNEKGASTKVTINPAPIYVDSLSIESGEHAYVGMHFNQITPVPSMVDDSGKSISGTAAWGSHAYDSIKDTDIDGDGNLDGQMMQSFVFTSADPNYQSGTYQGIIDVEYLEIYFVLPAAFGQTISEKLEYGQLYTYKNVADLFDSAFIKDVGPNAMPDGFVPYLKIDDTFIKIDSHRKNNNTAYTAVQSNKTVEVDFQAGTYTVTFNPDNGEATQFESGITYGRRLGKRANPTNGTQMFLGWYYPVLDANGDPVTDINGNPKFNAWDFDNDIVTEDITLTAKWLEPSALLSIVVRPKSGAKFEALAELDLSKIEVEATFRCELPDGGTDEITAIVPIDSNNTTVVYTNNSSSFDKNLHVNGNKDANKTTTVNITYTTSIKGTNQSASADLTISVDPIIVPTNGWVFDDKKVTYDGNPHTIVGIGSYDNSIITNITYTYLNASGQVVDAADVVKIGRYTVIASFETTEDYKVVERRATLQIVDAEVEVTVTWDSLTFVYNGQKQCPTPTFKDSDGNVLPLQYTASGVDNAINVNNYTITITLTISGYTIKAGEESTRFTISKAVLPVPTLNEGDIVYNGGNIDVTEHLDGFNPNIMEIASGGNAINAGNYSAVIKFKSDAAGNCSWEGISGSTVTVKWEIKKATAIADWGNNYKFVWDGSNHYPELVGIIDVFSIDQPAVDLSKLIYEGDINVSEMGAYTITVRVPASEDWFKNYTLENTSFDFVIVPSDNVELVSVVWENLVLVYNGEIQHPTYTVVDMDGNPVSADVLALIDFELPDSKWAGDYTAKANVKTGAEYFIRSGGTCAYKITVNAQGEGKDPNANNAGDGNGIKEFFEKLLASHFPLWQVCTMAASALLALIFLIKAAQYGSRARKAKGEAKKIASRAYASLLPIFSGEIVALNLSNKIWSIMAFAFVGLALLMFVVALITRHSWKKAELAKENAVDEREQRKYEAQNANQLALQEKIVQASSAGGYDNSALIEQMRLEMEAREARYREELARRDEEQARRDEEQARRDEEQAKRDEAMKLMFANLMGRQQGDDNFAYASIDDTDMLVQRVIAGLLPAMQQMMPEATAYLTAPQEQNDELIALVEEQKAIVEEQNEEIRNMSAQMNELQEQLAAMSQERADAIILPESNDEIMAEISALREQIANLSNQPIAVANADSSEEIKALTDKIAELQEQIASSDNPVVTTADNSEVLARMDEMQKQIAALSVGNTVTNTIYVEKEADDDDDDDEEEWDSILDEDDDDFLEAVIVEEDGTVKKASPNFRMRLKESSDKNREWYAAIKNLFCSQKGVTYRVYKRVEKIRYQGQVVAVIGIAKRSIKLWLALKPYEYDARRYHHKDVSDKPRFVDVPLYVRVGSDRALTRAEELILALFQDLNMEARKRYTDRSIQELIFTLKHNRLLTNKQYKQNLCEVMHVHDCDVLGDETAEKCIETKNVDFIDDSVIETVKLDDIDANFQDGNRVTLEKLRKLGLVSEDCTGYTVTADKRLTKPLIIVANDFTLPAVKLIALTGGRAIRLTQV
ncbi:MAG: uL15 family ribosomal protein [[Eubacterium] siraeum]|nr:uL15 family ribosomal protein [[Eubacterium] siraeum]